MTAVAYSVMDMVPNVDVKVRQSKYNWWITLESPLTDESGTHIEMTFYFKTEEERRIFMQHVISGFLNELDPKRPIPEAPPMDDEIPF